MGSGSQGHENPVADSVLVLGLAQPLEVVDLPEVGFNTGGGERMRRRLRPGRME